MTYPLYCLITYVVLFPNQISIFAKNINIINMCNTGGCCHDHSRERPEECCHGVKIDRFLNKCPEDPCDPCDRDCQDEPCVGYGCPIVLYDKCILYSGDELVADGIEKGTDLSVVIDSLRRIIASRDKQIDLYHREVLDLKKIINELVNAGNGGGDSGTEEEVW